MLVSPVAQPKQVTCGQAVIDAPFALHSLTGRLWTGFPRNPHNSAHLPGGSSSGTAAAVAVGLCPFGLGMLLQVLCTLALFEASAKTAAACSRDLHLQPCDLDVHHGHVADPSLALECAVAGRGPCVEGLS